MPSCKKLYYRDPGDSLQGANPILNHYFVDFRILGGVKYIVNY